MTRRCTASAGQRQLNSCKSRSQCALTTWCCGCEVTSCSSMPLRPKSSGVHQAEDNIRFHGFLYEWEMTWFHLPFLSGNLEFISHVAKTVSNCFSVLRQLRRIRQSVTNPVLQSLVVSLVLTHLDYSNATLAGLSSTLLDRHQSVLNAAACLIFSARKHDHISPLLNDLHWLRFPQRIEFKLTVLVYRCTHGTAPYYLADELCRVADIPARQRLRSAWTASLDVPVTRCSTMGDRSFSVAAVRVWNSLPAVVTSAPSLLAFRWMLKTELFCRSFPDN